MKATLFALLALVLYSAVNTIIERKLASISPLANILYIYGVLFAISLPLVMFRDQIGMKLTMPQGSNDVLLLLLCAIIFFFADFCWFKAYNSHGRLEQITATFLAFPILTTLMKGVSSGIMP